jgi:hypothetical protein
VADQADGVFEGVIGRRQDSRIAGAFVLLDRGAVAEIEPVIRVSASGTHLAKTSRDGRSDGAHALYLRTFFRVLSSWVHQPKSGACVVLPAVDQSMGPLQS